MKCKAKKKDTSNPLVRCFLASYDELKRTTNTEQRNEEANIREVMIGEVLFKKTARKKT
jgi:hypothetical protein